MKVFFLLLLLFGHTSAAFAQNNSTEKIVGNLQAMLAAEVAAAPSLPGELLHVHAPKLKLDVSLAAGVFDRDSKRPLEPHHVFRVASVTKTFTAAAILRLFEDGKIQLDDPINRYLPKDYLNVLEAGGYSTSKITVRHLLHHTSGIHDYAMSPQYSPAIRQNPSHRWTRMEQVQAAMNWGKPHNAPGEGYHYSDTGYILLGEIIERLSSKSLAMAYRSLLNFKKLNLDETWLESLEPAPAGSKELSHPYSGELDVIIFDPSTDLYGGGGLVSTVEDLARFYRALLRGEVFRKATTLQTMLTVPPINEQQSGRGYAMGIYRRKIGNQTCWGHTGFWGTAAFHCPDADVTITRHVNQASRDKGFSFDTLFQKIAERLQFATVAGQ